MIQARFYLKERIMAEHLKRDIDNLKKKLLTVGARVETSVRDAAVSISNHDPQLARQVIDRDVQIDYSEVEVEEECLKILALHQPVAIDLRFIVAVLKINNDLERIGDLAVNLAERAMYLAAEPGLIMPDELGEMAETAQSMLKNSLDALIEHNVELAHRVCQADDLVDEYNSKMYMKVQDAILADPKQITQQINILSASRHIERIADHTTNIAEDVIYMIEGQIIRHRSGIA